MPQLIRGRGLLAVVLTVAAVTACSATQEASVPTTLEAEEGVETSSPRTAAGTEAGEADQSADTAEPPAGAGTGGAEPSAGTETRTDQPSSPFQDVPEGYYVVDEGRAMVPERGGAGCEGLPSLESRTNATEDRVVGYWYSTLRDVGPIPRATGAAVYDEEGQPVAYVAAPGDAMSAIAARFCIDHYPYLEWINAIRRGEVGSILDLPGPMPLYAGDTINLSPYTIASVGDENGAVRDNAIDFHIPPQH